MEEGSPAHSCARSASVLKPSGASDVSVGFSIFSICRSTDCGAASSECGLVLVPGSGRVAPSQHIQLRAAGKPYPRDAPNWNELGSRARERYEDGGARLPDDPDARQRQLTRMGNAAGAAGLAELMDGGDGREWFARAAERYRESFEQAPAESWGRPIGAIKARILAGDWEGAAADARWAIDAGAGTTESPIGRYAAALAWGVLGDWDGMRVHADYARTHETFPSEVADALAFVAAEDVVGYVEAVGRARVVRDAGRISRGHARRGHGARAPGACRAARDGRRARVGAAAVKRAVILYDGN